MSTTTITHTPETIQLRKDIEALGKRNARQFEIISYLLSELRAAGRDIDILDIPAKDDIKPEPVYRPWTADEVPLGAQFRTKLVQFRGMAYGIITYADDGGIPIHYGNGTRWVGFKETLEKYEHSLDCGKTWLPCGVEEGVE